MSNINYVAKRNIISMAFSLSESTVSVSDADNSLNDTTNDLSGLNANEWVYITGFTDVNNNGWHQLLSASTADKIIINSNTTLVTEGAGNTVTLQGYLHGLGATYDLDFDLQRYTPQNKPIKNTVVSIGGTSTTLYQRTDNYYDCSTSYIDEADLPLWYEFFASVAANESFNFDAYGTSISPDNIVAAEINVDPSYLRVGQTDKFYISFRVKV